ncbi:unnamed protein product, partial [Amoebophrya sp. A25]|eukprot:GSA25T00018319001.1
MPSIPTEPGDRIMTTAEDRSAEEGASRKKMKRKTSKVEVLEDVTEDMEKMGTLEDAPQMSKSKQLVPMAKLKKLDPSTFDSAAIRGSGRQGCQHHGKGDAEQAGGSQHTALSRTASKNRNRVGDN